MRQFDADATRVVQIQASSSAPAASSRYRRLLANPRLTVLVGVYLAQALAGSVVGFAVPFLYYFGVL